MPSRVSLRAQLETYCRSRLAPSGHPCIVDWIPLTGGWEHEVYAVALETGPPADRRIQRLVLRLNPREEAGPAVAHEARTLTLLADAGFRAPRLRAAETTCEALGAPFVLVEHISGRPLVDAMPRATPEARERLRTSYCALLARLHQLDWHPFADEETRQGLTLDALMAAARRVCSDLPSLARAVAWLEQHRPLIDEQRAVLHGDPHLANTLVDDAGGLVLIDWSASGVGDPRVDLSRSMIIVRGYGTDARRDMFVAAYVVAAGRVPHLEWFEVLAAVRHLGMVAERAAARHTASSDGPHAEAAARISAFVERVIAAPPAP